jgi:hypothetical protein
MLGTYWEHMGNIIGNIIIIIILQVTWWNSKEQHWGKTHGDEEEHELKTKDVGNKHLIGERGGGGRGTHGEHHGNIQGTWLERCIGTWKNNVKKGTSFGQKQHELEK